MSAYYVIHYTAARHTGRTIPEGTGEASVARYIAAGNVDGKIDRIDCYDPDEGWARIVTEDIARAVANSVEAWESITPEVRDFIEGAAGLEYARGLYVIDRSFAAA